MDDEQTPPQPPPPEGNPENDPDVGSVEPVADAPPQRRHRLVVAAVVLACLIVAVAARGDATIAAALAVAAAGLAVAALTGRLVARRWSPRQGLVAFAALAAALVVAGTSWLAERPADPDGPDASDRTTVTAETTTTDAATTSTSLPGEATATTTTTTTTSVAVATTAPSADDGPDSSAPPVIENVSQGTVPPIAVDPDTGSGDASGGTGDDGADPDPGDPASEPADEPPLATPEAVCFEEQGVDADVLLAAIADPSADGQARRTELVAATARCAPRLLLSDTYVDDVRTGISSGLRGTITTDEARCATEQVLDQPEPAVVLQGGDAATLLSSLIECAGDDTRRLLERRVVGGPQQPGDDAEFDQLAGLCRNGSEQACDVLFTRAPAWSGYAKIAVDCAGCGLTEAGACTSGFADGNGDGFFDLDSGGWAGALDACRGGDMVACDFAFDMSPIDSDIELVGQTCGGRETLWDSTCLATFGERAN